jgi:hypothetical protein
MKKSDLSRRLHSHVMMRNNHAIEDSWNVWITKFAKRKRLRIVEQSYAREKHFQLRRNVFESWKSQTSSRVRGRENAIQHWCTQVLSKAVVGWSAFTKQRKRQEHLNIRNAKDLVVTHFLRRLHLAFSRWHRRARQTSDAYDWASKKERMTVRYAFALWKDEASQQYAHHFCSIFPLEIIHFACTLFAFCNGFNIRMLCDFLGLHLRAELRTTI